MKFNYRYVLLGIVTIAAYGQSAVDAHIGLGTAHAGASSGGIDSTTFASCSPRDKFTGTCQTLPALGGLFVNIGGDIMFTDRFGAGGQFAVTSASRDYGPLKYRQTFFDGNGLYEPVRNKRYVLQLQGGIGVARTSFSYNSTSCVGTAVCTSQSQVVGSSGHFQMHLGAAVQVFVTEHIFVKPQFDYHYVPGLSDQFGGSSVPMIMINVGYGTRR